MAHADDASTNFQELLKNAKTVPRFSPCLEPEDSPFSLDVGIRFYEQMLTESLLGSTQREAQSLAPIWQQEENAILICLPSFQPEWTLSVVGDRSSRYWVLLAEAQSSLWLSTTSWYSTAGNPFPVPPSVKIYRSEMAADLGGEVCEIWRRVLSQTRYPQEHCDGCDGVIYHFTYSRRGTKGIPRRSGKTWSPEEDSVPGKLVGLSHTLADYAKDPVNRDVFLEVIQDRVRWFQERSQQFSN